MTIAQPPWYRRTRVWSGIQALEQIILTQRNVCFGRDPEKVLWATEGWLVLPGVASESLLANNTKAPAWIMKGVSREAAKRQQEQQFTYSFSTVISCKDRTLKCSVIKLTFLTTVLAQKKMQFSGECQFHQHASGPVGVSFLLDYIKGRGPNKIVWTTIHQEHSSLRRQILIEFPQKTIQVSMFIKGFHLSYH